MKLNSAKFSNLFSIGEVYLNLSKRGLVLISGESLDEGGTNGSGKSSISSKGIIWALYGVTSGGLRAGNVVNRHGGKSATGEVEFVDSRENTWLVKRSRPQKLELFKNGENVSAKSTSETQEMIDTAIGMNLITFVQTSHFGQGRSQSYAGLTAKDQKALLEQILPMSEIDAWARYASAQLKEAKDRLGLAENVESRAKGLMMGQAAELGRLQGASHAWIESHRQEVDDLIHQRNVAENGQMEARTQLEWTRTQLAAIDMDTLSAEQIVLEDAVREAEESHVAVVMTLRGAQDVWSQWDRKASGLDREIKKLQEGFACPTCERDYDDETCSVIAQKISELKAERGAALVEMGKAGEAEDWYKDAVQEAVAVKKRNEDELGAVTLKLEEAVRYTYLIERKERELKDVISPFNIKIEQLESQVNIFPVMILEAAKELEEAGDRQEAAETALANLNKEIEHLRYWGGVYSKELKLKMFEECCTFLDDHTAHHLKGLRNEQFKVKFSTVKRLANGDTKDEFAVTVESDTGGGNFESLSGGEQQMVSFAIGLALADLAACKTASKPEFLIMDEPFSELDERNSESIVDYLTGEFGRARDTLLLISNEASLQGLVPDRIHVVKQGGVSNVQV